MCNPFQICLRDKTKVQGGLHTAYLQRTTRRRVPLIVSLVSLIGANGPDFKRDASTESSRPLLQRAEAAFGPPRPAGSEAESQAGGNHSTRPFRIQE